MLTRIGLNLGQKFSSKKIEILSIVQVCPRNPPFLTTQKKSFPLP